MFLESQPATDILPDPRSGSGGSLGEDLVCVHSGVASADCFAAVSATCELHDVLVKRGSIDEEVRSGELGPVRANTAEAFEAVRTVLALTEEMIALTDELQEFGAAMYKTLLSSRVATNPRSRGLIMAPNAILHSSVCIRAEANRVA